MSEKSESRKKQKKIVGKIRKELMVAETDQLNKYKMDSKFDKKICSNRNYRNMFKDDIEKLWVAVRKMKKPGEISEVDYLHGHLDRIQNLLLEIK